MRPGTAIGFSVIAHALAAAGVTVASSRIPRVVVPKPPPSAFWVTMPERTLPPPPAVLVPPEPKASPPPVPQPPERARRAEVPAPHSAQPAAPSTPPDASSSPLTAPGRALELEEARRRAASEVLQERAREGAYRSLTFPGTLAEHEAFDEAERFRRVERGLQAPLTAFDSPSKGRAGLSDTSPWGQTTRWISDECAQTSGTNNPFILPSLQALAGMPVTRCTDPVRDDLFATAKPDYLMDDEERAATDAALERRERLRRPTTGAVLPLADK